MPCTVKLQITNLKDGEKVPQLLSIFNVPNANVTLDQIAKAILNLDKGKRSQIAEALREASVQTLTEDDVKNHQFVSNTTLEGLQKEFTDLKQAFPNISTEETPILVKAKKIELNGNNYYGRVLDAKGQEIFIINGYYGALKLFQYLDTKNKIKQAIKEDTLKEDLKEYKEDLEALSTKYNISLEELLLNYLEDKNQYKPFKTKEGKTIIPFKTLGSIYAKITNKYDITKGKSEMQLLLSNINKEQANRFKYVINFNTLNNNLKLLVNDVPEFKNMSNNEVIAYLKQLFSNDVKLLKAKIDILGGQRKVSDW